MDFARLVRDMDRFAFEPRNPADLLTAFEEACVGIVVAFQPIHRHWLVALDPRRWRAGRNAFPGEPLCYASVLRD